MQSPLTKFSETPILLTLPKSINSDNLILIAYQSDIKLNQKNQNNNLALAFLVDCLKNKYKISFEMIEKFFQDNDLDWHKVSNKLTLCYGDKIASDLLRYLKYKPERLLYSVCGAIVIKNE